MERNHLTRIPVHLNAVLIGKHTVPKGCRVRNVSEQGMMLNCEADGRILTFKYDDSVDIHLLFQDDNGCRYLTKTANVRHVHENSIGVEFLHPDTELVELLKACNVVDNHIHAATAANDQEIHTAASPDNTREPDELVLPATMNTARNKVQAGNTGNKRFDTGIAALFAVAGTVIAAFIYTADLNARIDTLEAMVNTHSNELEIIKVASVASGALDAGIADLNRRMESLTDSFAALEQRLSPSAVRPSEDSVIAIPGEDTVAPPTRESAKPEPEEANAVKTAKSSPATATGRSSAATLTTAEPGRSGGPWVINLSSSRDQAATSRFLNKALAQGIPVEQQQLAIRDKVYWRLQVTGFSSADEARAYSVGIKEKLGLKDVWIHRQQN